MFGSEKPPDRLFPAHTASWASLQLFGTISLNDGVVPRLWRSWYRPSLGSNSDARWVELQSPESRIDANHGSGLCLATYWSVAFALLGLGYSALVPPSPDTGDGPTVVSGAPQYSVPASCVGPDASGYPRSCA